MSAKFLSILFRFAKESSPDFFRLKLLENVIDISLGEFCQTAKIRVIVLEYKKIGKSDFFRHFRPASSSKR